MKFLITLIGLALLSGNVNGQGLDFNKNTKIYLVRHAEKGTGDDPVLTDAGKKRAGDLMRTLKYKNVKRIYVTQYRRSQMTADSMRIQLAIDTVHYDADITGQSIQQKIQARHDMGKTILIIGHSNTIPVYIRKLGVVNFTLPEIPANEFDNLYLVSFKRKFIFFPLKAYLTSRKYGALSSPSATMQ